MCRVIPGKPEWARISAKNINNNETDKSIKFSFKFNFPVGAERVYFAYSFPWSTNDNVVGLILSQRSSLIKYSQRMLTGKTFISRERYSLEALRTDLWRC